MSKLYGYWLFAAVLVCTDSLAALSLSPTRIVFVDKQREVGFFIANKAAEPVIVQAWIDDGDPAGNPDTSQAPFVVLPPIFRLSAESVQGLRIILTQQKQTLPSQQESLFWLNLYELPALPHRFKQEDARLVFAVKTQVKLFFRPHGLRLTNQQRIEQMSFNLIDKYSDLYLNISNNSALYMSLANLTLLQDKQQQSLAVTMLAPFESQQFLLAGNHYDLSQPIQLDFSFLDDAGNLIERQKLIQLSEDSSLK